MGQSTDHPAYLDRRASFELKTEEEKQLYRDLKAAAVLHRITLRDLMVRLMRQALTQLQRQTLLPDQPLRLSKKKGVERLPPHNHG